MLILSLALLAAAEPPPANPLKDFVVAAQARLGAVTSAPKVSSSRVVALAMDLSPSGEVVRLGLAAGSGDNAIDDAARAWLLAAEPFAPPSPELLGNRASLECMVRAAFSKGKPTAQVGCFSAEGSVATIADAPPVDKDAPSLLLQGFAKEAAGDLASAEPLYKESVAKAPAFAWAARAYGLLLVKAKKVPQAIPYLRTYVNASLGRPDAFSYAREIERFDKEMAAKAAEFTRVRPRLSKEDIVWGMRKGYALLEPCLEKARQQKQLAVGSDTLVITWKILKNGRVETASLEQPDTLSISDAGECIEKTVRTWHFPPYSEGSEITAKSVPIKVRGVAPVAAQAAGGSSSPVEEVAEVSFARCERSADEITGLIQRSNGALRSCIQAEQKRNPKAEWPGQVPVSFIVDTAGPVRDVSVEHRFFRAGPFEECVRGALKSDLGPAGGADCPAQFELGPGR